MTLQTRVRLRSLDELYINKQDSNRIDINIQSPKYEYTNLEYGRCKRIGNNAEEIQFSEDHLKHNYILLIRNNKNGSE